jgi:hypothetical protein
VSGEANRTYMLDITIVVRPVERGQTVYNEGLRVQEDLTVNANGFLAVAAILGRFHDLGQSIKAEIEASKTQYERDCEAEGLPLVPDHVAKEQQQ